MSRPVLLALLVVLGFALAGCTVLESEPTREDEAVDALADAMAAAEDVETYEYESDMTVTDGTDSIHASMVGTVDLEGEAAHTIVTYQGETHESYQIGDTTYRECPDPWGGWGVEHGESDADWLTGTPLGSHLALLASGDLSYEGVETVDDRETVHLVGSPPPSEFDDDASGGTSPLDFGGPSVDDVTVEIWLDAETDLPVKATVEFEVSERGETVTSTVTTTFGAYDETESVELPHEVADDARDDGCPGAAP